MTKRSLNSLIAATSDSSVAFSSFPVETMADRISFFDDFRNAARPCSNGRTECDLQRVQVALGSRVDRGDLNLDVHRGELGLLQELDHPLAAGELRLRGLVEVRAELGESREVAVLRQIQAQRAGDLFHGLDLGVAADAGDRDADVDGRPHARVEEVALEVDLAVGDRDDVRRDVRRHVARLRLDDRQRRQRTAALGVRQLGRALEQARVQVEHVAGIRLAPRRAAQEERDLAVRRGVLGEVVVDRQGVLLVVEEPLAHRASGVRSDVEHRRRVRGCRGHDDRVLHRSVLCERLGDLGDGRLLLADDDVDADDALALLVDDRVEGDGRLAGLAVADDQLALPAADRDHGVDRLQARLDGLLDALPVDDARGDALDRVELGRRDGTLVVDRAAERVDDASDERRSDGHLDDAPRAADLLALLDLLRFAQEHDADLVLLEVEREAEDVVPEVDELARHDLVEAVDARDAVSDREHGADLGHVDRLLVAGQLLLQDRRDLVRLDLHLQAPVPFAFSWKRRIPAARRGVEHVRAHVGHEPRQDLRIDVDFDFHGAAHPLRQRLARSRPSRPRRSERPP